MEFLDIKNNNVAWSKIFFKFIIKLIFFFFYKIKKLKVYEFFI
jgi:hypothetical protein